MNTQTSSGTTASMGTTAPTARRGIWIALGLAVVAVALWLMSGVASAAPTDEGTATGPEGSVTVSVSAGNNHSCAVRSSDPYPGLAVCWGDNSSGQAGFPGVGWAVQVSAGRYHSCSLGSDGSVSCWGRGTQGQTTVPPGFYTKVSAGQYHTCAIRVDRSLACWGLNEVGSTTPPGGTFRDVSAGDGFACGLRSLGGVVECWGSGGGFGRTSPPTGEFVQVSTGLSHACGLRSNGQLACWGQGNTGAQAPPSGTFRQVSAGSFHTCAVRDDGTLVCWANLSITNAPAPPPGTFIQVSAGMSGHDCGVRSEGSVACWGANNFGQSAPPADKFMLPAISAGDTNTCGVKWSDAQLSCWGTNSSPDPSPPAGTFIQESTGTYHICGVRSDGTVACSGLADAVANTPAGAFTQVSAGQAHTCGLRSDFTLACWGFNDKGQASPPTGRFIEVSAGDKHTCALRDSGNIACWGENGSGQADPPGHYYDGVSAGGSHACALNLVGYVECWGANSFGQSAEPELQAVQVRAGGRHSCALAFNHVGICWGSGDAGQKALPNQPYASLSAGTNHTCAVERWRSVVCVGYNPDGRVSPLITSPGPPNGPAGAPYNHRFTTTFVSPALQFTVKEGTLPPGLSLGLAGGLVGTPTQDGSYPATVCANSVPPFAPTAGVCQSFNITVGKGQPTVTLTPSAGGPVGTRVRATATLTGGFSPANKMVFALYSDSTCNTPVFSANVNVVSSKATSPYFTPTAPGTYHWVATYAGDAYNEPAIAPCGTPGQSVTIMKATPTLTGKASPGGARGTSLRDTATLAGGYQPTGSVTFRLYSDAGCATQVFASTNNLAGLTATSGAFTPTTAGIYRWRAFYSGNANNKAVATPCNAANQTVEITPTIGPPSTRTLTGDVAGPVRVGAGETVKITGARVLGDVVVDPGGTLEVLASEVRGIIAAVVPASIRLCGSQVVAPAGSAALDVWGAVEAVRLGDPANGCAGNRFVGDVTLRANSGVNVVTNLVSGKLTVDANGPEAVAVKANVVSGALACADNDPAPTNGGLSNTAGSKTGQCSTV